MANIRAKIGRLLIDSWIAVNKKSDALGLETVSAPETETKECRSPMKDYYRKSLLISKLPTFPQNPANLKPTLPPEFQQRSLFDLGGIEP